MKLVHYEFNRDDNGYFTSAELTFKIDTKELEISRTYVVSAIAEAAKDVKALSMTSKGRTNGTSLIEVKITLERTYRSAVEISEMVDDIEKKANEAKKRLNL